MVFVSACNQFARGVISMLGAVSPDSFDTIHSYLNTFQMPYVTPWFPEKVKIFYSKLGDAINNSRSLFFKKKTLISSY